MPFDKKTSLLYVLKVLEEYTDENHLMTYQMIAGKLYSCYSVEIERKTIASHVDVLSQFGYDIVKCGKNGLYLGARDFEEGELLFLIDAIYSSKSMPTAYAKDLVKRLSKSFSKYAMKRYNHLEKIDDGTNVNNKQIFYTIEILNAAIEQKKKVEFQYVAYNLNKELQLKNEGMVYKVSPYFMVNNRGKYYLVCNFDKYNDISHFKIECITNIKVLEEDVKEIETVSGGENFSIKDYIKEHIYMVSGKTVEVKLKIAKEKYVNDVIDWFGKDIVVEKKNDDVFVNLKANETALVYWALQYGEHVEVVEPVETRQKTKEALISILKKYE